MSRIALKAKSKTPTPLRHLAEARLREGTPPPSVEGWTTGVEALTLLHKLAGSPASAADALKLLHELQVHQVELTLQHEQQEQNQAEVTEALDRYAERFDFAPVGYVAVEPDGRIIEGNVATAELFEIEQAELSGRPVESLVAPESRVALRALFNRLRQSGTRESCEVEAKGGNPPRRLQVAAKSSPRTGWVYMTFSDLTDANNSDRHS